MARSPIDLARLEQDVVRARNREALNKAKAAACYPGVEPKT